MRDKLLDLMKSEDLKPSQLAERLGINPAGISHILAGRNKPGFDLLQKILRRFPRVNPDWLLLDSNKMYRDEIPSSPEPRATIPQMKRPEDLFDQTPLSATNIPSPGASRLTEEARTTGGGDQPYRLEDYPVSGNEFSTQKPAADVERVIILYSDHTCESFTPTKR